MALPIGNFALTKVTDGVAIALSIARTSSDKRFRRRILMESVQVIQL